MKGCCQRRADADLSTCLFLGEFLDSANLPATIGGSAAIAHLGVGLSATPSMKLLIHGTSSRLSNARRTTRRTWKRSAERQAGRPCAFLTSCSKYLATAYRHRRRAARAIWDVESSLDDCPERRYCVLCSVRPMRRDIPGGHVRQCGVVSVLKMRLRDIRSIIYPHCSTEP